MKTLAALAVLIALTGCSQHAPTSNTFALAAGENSGFPLAKAEPVRVTVDAEQPDTVALVSQSALAAWRAKSSTTIAPSQIVCMRAGILRAEFDCAPKIPVEFVVSDQRGMLDTAAAGLTLVFAKDSKQANAAMAKNRVTVTVTPRI